MFNVVISLYILSPTTDTKYNIFILYISFFNNLLNSLYFQSFFIPKESIPNVIVANPELSYP